MDSFLNMILGNLEESACFLHVEVTVAALLDRRELTKATSKQVIKTRSNYVHLRIWFSRYKNTCVWKGVTSVLEESYLFVNDVIPLKYVRKNVVDDERYASSEFSLLQEEFARREVSFDFLECKKTSRKKTGVPDVINMVTDLTYQEWKLNPSLANCRAGDSCLD